MEYRKLGKAGIKLSELSFGSWITFGLNLDLNGAKQCLRAAIDAGVNFFDNAEVYASGAAELIMGEAFKDYRREDLVIATKLFWGGPGPNDTGLSFKHLMEGIRSSLKRLQLSYVDLLFCHRPDPTTPIEETVRAMDIIVRSGLAFYWGTSEWSAEEIEEAHEIAEALNAIPPSMEQPQYNLFARHRVEKEYRPLYRKYGMGITAWSPLASGILTGKYNNGIPKGSRLDHHKHLQDELTKEKIERVKALEKIAKELGCTLPQLSIAWGLKNPNVSSIITGATHPSQVIENMKASEVKEKLTPEIMKKIDTIFAK
jgi:voltage-dependent potassium channel beta subunit